MARTVKVGLDVDEAPYVRGVERAEKATAKLDDAVESAGGSAKETAAGMGKASESITDMGDSARGAGRELSGLGQDAARLDRQIADTARGIRELAREIARTADEAERAKLADKLKVERRSQRDLVNLRKLIDVDSGAQLGEELAEKVAVSFSARLGPLIARIPMGGMSPAAAAVAAPFAIAAGSVVATALQGAVVGGVGVGGVLGGLMVAARDARVKSAATALGTEFGDLLGRSAHSFVPATLNGIDLIDARMRGLEPSITRIFDRASVYIEPLIDDAFRTIEHMMPGIIRTVEQAGPVLDSLGDGFVRLGDAASDVLTMMADNADEGARALDLLFMTADVGIRTIGNSLEALTTIFDFLDEHGGWTWKMLTGTQEAGRGADELKGKYEGLKFETRSMEEQVDALKAAFDELFGVQMSVDQAAINYRQGLRDLNEELKEGKRTLALNSEEGLKNRQAMLDQIGVIEQQRAARLANGETLDVVDKKYRNEIESLRKSAIEAGFKKTEVDALVAAYKAIPAKAETTITANTTPAMSAAVRLRQYLRDIPDEDINVAIRITGASRSAAESALRKQYANRWGNIYHAESGLLREANTWGPGDTLYAFREPATRGEAFIPRSGDTARSRVIAQTVVEDWLGGQVRWPAGGGGTAPAAMPVMGSPYASPAQISAAAGGMTLRVVVDDGTVQGLVRVEVDEAFGALADAQVYQTVE